MRRWRLYYADGSTYDDLQGSPYDAPPRGLLVIVMRDDEVGRVVLAGADNYAWKGWGWTRLVPTDALGLADYLGEATAACPSKVVRGATVSNAAFAAAMRRAMTDPDFPLKSATDPSEVTA